jgi:membrane-associated phospholipid phosphatase
MLLTKKEKYALISLFVVLIAVFTFLDLPFTKLVFDRDSLFGRFFWVFGELPSTFIGTAGFAFLAMSYTKNNNIILILNILIFGLLSILLGLLMGFQVLHYLEFEVMPFALMGSLISLLLLYVSSRMSIEKKKHLRIYAIIVVLTVFLSILIPNIIKILWARPRYRIFNGDDSLFRAWYDRSGITNNDDWKSFPSGHSALSTSILLYTFLPQLFDKLKGKERQIMFFCSVWIVLVMLSRVVMGDHFVTDTLFGTGITLLLFAGFKKLFLKQ